MIRFEVVEDLAWVGNEERVIALILGKPSQPIVLLSDAAQVWMAIIAKQNIESLLPARRLNEIIESLKQVSLIRESDKAILPE